MAVVLLGLSACAGGDDDEALDLDPRSEQRQTTTQPVETLATVTLPPLTPPSTTEAVVIYEVEGSGSAMVTYAAAGFSQEQQTVPLPWSHEIRGDVPEYPVLVAQLQGAGAVTCRIWGGGTVPLAEATSNGQYAVVNCADD